MGLDKEKFKGFWVRSLRVDILGAFLTLLLFSTVSMIIFTYSKDSKMIVEFAEEYMDKVSEVAMNRTQDLLQDAEKSARVGSQLVNFLSDVSLENSDLVDYMFAVIRYNPYFENYYLGMSNGSFLMVTRLPENPKDLASLPENPPEGSYIRVRFIDRSKGKESDTWVYYNKEGVPIDTRKRSLTSFDPRDRPWYIDVGNRSAGWTSKYTTGKDEYIYFKKKAFWTDVYIFQSDQRRGISVSDPIFTEAGEFIGMFGTDLSLAGMSEFLGAQKIGRGGKEIIINEKGEVIASPSLVEDVKKRGVESPSLSTSKAALFEMAFKKHQEEKKDEFSFIYQDEKYLASIRHFPESFEKKWMVMITVPLDAFLGAVLKTHAEVLFISLAILLLSILAVIWLAKKLSQPIVKLAKEIDQIREFKLDHEIDIKSNIKEIIRIATATASMQKAIRSFSYFVPKELVQKLITHGKSLSLGGESKRLTIFFSDIQDFTQISEGLKSEDLMIYLSDYLDEMSKVIIDLQGTIDKYIGDNVMAFWGAPEVDAEDSYHGCKAALLCIQKISELNQKWSQENRPSFYTRIGLHKADVVVGNIGTHERRNYTIIGDGVNLASRLEALNRFYQTQIIISEDLYNEVKDRFLTRPLDIVEVKGKQQRTKIYELIAEYNTKEATEEKIQFCRRFTEAYTYYLGRRWQESLSILQELQKSHPDDRPIKFYIEQIEEYQKNPPEETWQGTHKINPRLRVE